MEWFSIGYKFLGGLAFFFYGMNLLSQSLQKMASDYIRRLINSLTTNRLLAVLVGASVTMIIQSSSVTTVMVVGFVNAGLMQLTQAIGVIFGANIGTTITGWILAIKVGKYGLLLVGLGIFPMLFFRNQAFKNLGTLLFALGLVFFGLETMSGAFKPLRAHPDFLQMLTYFSADTLPSLLAAIGMGCLLTMVVQSSSAMLGVTIALAGTGIISFQTGVALVLGENIGTTITALLASIGANTNARRAARAHACFNLFGVGIMVIIFHPYIGFIEWLIHGQADFLTATGDKPFVAAHIAASHSIFNVSATLLFLPFIQYLAKLVTFITPEKRGEREVKTLKYLGSVSDMSPALALEAAHMECQNMSEIVEKTLLNARSYILSDKKEVKSEEQVKKYEAITDNIQKEVMLFLSKVMEGSLTEEQTIQLNNLIRISDELESIADYCDSLVQYRKRLFDNQHKFNEASFTELTKIFDGVFDHYKLCVMGLDDFSQLDIEACIDQERELGVMADEIRDAHLQRIQEGIYQPLTGLTFSDMMVALRRIKNHSVNIAQSLAGGKALL